MSKETSTDLASLAATYLGMTDEQLSDIPYPQLFDIIRQLAGSVLSQSESDEIIQTTGSPDVHPHVTQSGELVNWEKGPSLTAALSIAGMELENSAPVSTPGHPDPHVEPTNDDQPKDGD
jgi:hypothetical protein